MKKQSTIRSISNQSRDEMHSKGTIMNQAKQARLALPIALAAALAACGGGNDPDPQNVPIQPQATSADLGGNVVKGTLSYANVAVEALNGSNLSLSNAATDQHGQLMVELMSDPGFGIDSLIKVSVTADASSSMVCDASACGDVALGGEVTGAGIDGTELATLGYIAVPYNSSANGSADASVQVSALTTLATRMIESAIAEGRNVSTPELLELAQGEYSASLLRAIGWQTNNTNVFSTPIVSADAFENFIDGQDCQDVGQTDEEGNPVVDENGNPVTEEVCTDALLGEASIKLSLLNAAFAQFSADSSQQSSLEDAYANLIAAFADEPDALEAFRQPLYDAVAAHPLTTELGFTADALIDLGLTLKDEQSSGGPVHEITTADNLASATITARSSIGDGENQDKAFDKDAETKWLDHNDWQGPPSEDDPSWIQVDFTEPQAVSSLMITSANDAPARDPENFTLLASNDGGENWVTLTEVVGAAFDERFERQEFRFANALKYSSYRLNITKNAGNDGLMQLAEIRMLGPIFTSVDHSDTGNGVATARFSIGDGENQDKAFDNNPETKWLDHNDWQGPPTAEDPSWIQMDFPQAVAVNALAITSANDAPARDPENFDLVASNDGGTTWITIGSWVGEAFDDRFERRVFNATNQLAYTTYRLNISKNQGNDGLMQVGEIELIGPELPGLNHAAEVGASYSARFSISDGESAAQAFDGDVNTKWLDHNEWQGPPTAEDPAWVQVDLPEARVVNTLSLTTANDAPARDPENFELVASNDGGDSWVTLASWVGEAFDERFERRDFSFSNSLAYSTYRLNISKNAGNDGLFQIAEVGLIGPQYAATDHSEAAGVAYSARNRIGDAENEAKAFDNDPQTKWLDHNDWQGPPSEEDPSWIQIDLIEAKIVSTLAITSANDAPGRDPENFQLLGSNDGGASWEVIAEWVGESWDERFQRRVFEFGNGLAYTSYRLNITKNNDSLVQISEIELIGIDQ